MGNHPYLTVASNYTEKREAVTTGSGGPNRVLSRMENLITICAI